MAGFLAASVTGACIAFGFWGWVAGTRNGGRDVVWSWDEGVRGLGQGDASVGMGAGGPLGLLVIAVVSGVISGVAEALGAFFFFLARDFWVFLETNYQLDLGSIDDNLSLPIISGCFILGFIKVLGLAATAFSWFS